jgi:hypothetical protein
MSRPRITVVGTLMWSEEYGLGAAVFSIDVPRAFATIQSKRLDKNIKFVVEPQISYETSQLEKRPELPKRVTDRHKTNGSR